MPKLSLEQAAKMWATEKRRAELRAPALRAAAEVLKDWFRRTKRRDYKGAIGYAYGTRMRTDEKKLKAYLGASWNKFQRRESYEQLSLLGKKKR